MVLIDSSVWIEGFRKTGKPELKKSLKSLLEADKTLLASPVRLEVLGGARKSERRTIAASFAIVQYRRSDEKDWERAITLSWLLRDKGLNLPWLDILIASIAIHDQIPIYTIDKHFGKIAELTSLKLHTPGDSLPDQEKENT